MENLYKKIECICIDVDGTLTDGMYQVSGNGIITKSFNTRDFYAMEMAMDQGIAIKILTGASDKCIKEKIRGITNVSGKWYEFLKNGLMSINDNCLDKKSEVQLIYLGENHIFPDKIAYIGDFLNDIDAMEECVFTGCPNDAIQEVRDNSNYISDFCGGKGAVCDFIFHILKKRNEEI